MWVICGPQSFEYNIHCPLGCDTIKLSWICTYATVPEVVRLSCSYFLCCSSGMVPSVGANLSPDQTFGSIKSLSVSREVASFPLSRTPTPPPNMERKYLVYFSLEHFIVSPISVKCRNWTSTVLGTFLIIAAWRMALITNKCKWGVVFIWIISGWNMQTDYHAL